MGYDRYSIQPDPRVSFRVGRCLLFVSAVSVKAFKILFNNDQLDVLQERPKQF